MSAIEVKNLVKKFHGQTVLHGIDLEVKPGEVVAIIGPSGSGKTTLLRSINLLEQPEAGTITVGDITIDTARSLSQQKSLIRQLRQHVGFVFQNFNLFPHRTVLENIIEGPVIVKGEPKEEATARARELLAKVGLAGKETSYPRRLSGGQQQRVAIARALAMRPGVILFDEPTSALDPELVGDALRSCVNTGISVRGMDMALTGAQAAAQTLISACQHREPQNLFPLYHHNVERSLLWDVLQRYQHVPALLQRPGWYRTWPALMQDISRDLWDQGDKPVPPLRQLFWHHLRRHGLWHLAGDVIRSLRCL